MIYKLWLILTPYVMYFVGLVLIISCVWDKGKEARKSLGLFSWFIATVILGLIIFK